LGSLGRLGSFRALPSDVIEIPRPSVDSRIAANAVKPSGTHERVWFLSALVL
jgi:hypothetical protein